MNWNHYAVPKHQDNYEQVPVILPSTACSYQARTCLSSLQPALLMLHHHLSPLFSHLIVNIIEHANEVKSSLELVLVEGAEAFFKLLLHGFFEIIVKVTDVAFEVC